MAKMRIYTVHIQPEKKNPYENPVFIEEHFNWWAFIFRGFWFLYHRMWLVGVLLIAFEVGLHALALKGLIAPSTSLIIRLGVQVLLGFHAGDLRRIHLKKQGYITTDIVTGDNPVLAEQRFFDRYYPAHRTPFVSAHSPSSRPAH